MSSAKIHLVLADLLYNCLILTERDACALSNLHLPNPFQYPKEYKPEPLLAGYKAETRIISVEVDGHRFASSYYSELYFQGVRSIPGFILNGLACSHLSKRYDLEGVPGFYFNNRWRLNIIQTSGLIKPYRNETGRLAGLFIYESPADTRPSLLSSKGLYKGTEAIQPVTSIIRDLA